MAVVSLFIIACYLLVAAVVTIGTWAGAITVSGTDDRVGMQDIPGFFLEQTPEKRLEDYEVQLEDLERAAKAADPEQALQELTMGRVEVADLSAEEILARCEEGWKIVDVLAEKRNLDSDDSALEKLNELEELVNSMRPYPEGWDGFVQSSLLILGTDRQGRSISYRATYSISVAIWVGVVTAVVSVLIGTVLGASAGYFGGFVDHIVIWLYTTFSSIPNLVLLVLLAYLFTGDIVQGFLEKIYLKNSLLPLYVAFCCTFWIGPCRVIRGEVLKIKELEYVQAATVAGFGSFYILFRHIVPNVAHLMLVNFSLLFIGAIKSEVILSFLDLGVKEGPSWGIMISQSASEVVMGFFWQIGAATCFMFVLVLAFNILSDALQDAFDPRHE